MTDQEIADSLSEAQRDQFLHPLLASGWYYKAPLGSTTIAMPPDCIEHVTTRPGYVKYKLTETGLRVRALLEKKNG
jgi:hypothetical protein